MSASARLRATAEAVPSVHETSERAVRALVCGVPPAALGVAGWPAWGASLPLTTVFFVSLAMVAAVVCAAAIVDEPNARGSGARPAWLYATVVTVGYLVRRGLAKSGSRDRYTRTADGVAQGDARSMAGSAHADPAAWAGASARDVSAARPVRRG
jgi:hypothetical protein